uniref:carboxypeptidase-like regulatory domain-containing protein n=1 Tax=Prevotella sp. TaxID=59823 RepID=UPI003FF07895
MLSFSSSAAMAGTTPVKTPEAFAQQQGTVAVKGVVKDSNGEPIIGATVKAANGKVGAITDINGNFSIDVKPGASLEISSIGYASTTVKVGQSRQLSVVLKDDSHMLNEVVAIGYGAATKKKDLSAAVGVVSNVDELAVRPVTSTEGMLQGQLAGVTVQADGGDPTAAPNIVIRGQGSQNGDNVLWVVDGVPGAPISSLNDIESIVVLKDAASAAIYGAQSGAGGVVLVTTKKAKKGATSISYDGMVGIRNAMNLPTPLNAEQEIQMRKISYGNASMEVPAGWDVNKNPWIATTRTNWMDEIFRTAFYQRHNVSLNSGSDTFANRLSFSYDNDEGILQSTFNKNLAIHYNGKYQINKWVSISEDFVWKNTENRTTATNEGYTGPILSAIYMPASAEAYSQFTESGFGGVTTQDPTYIA